MPVLVNCGCGRQLRVPDELVGRRVKCPACGNPQLVEAAPARPKSSVAPARRTATAPEVPGSDEAKDDRIRFACDGCGRQVKARAEYAGRSTKCPGCGETLHVPPAGVSAGSSRRAPAEERLRSEPPAPRRPARPSREVEKVEEVEEVEEVERADEPDDSDDDDRPARRPKRRKGKKGKAAKQRSGGGALPWILGGLLLLLLLGGGGVGAYFLFFRGSGGDALATFVPKDAVGFVSFRASDLAKTDAMKNVKTMIPAGAAGGKDFAAEFDKEFGLKFEDVERFTIVFQEADATPIWGVFTTVKPYDKTALLSKAAPDAKEFTVEGRKYYKGTGTDAIHLIDSRSFLSAKEADLKRALELAARKDVSGPLADAIKEVGGSQDLIFGAFSVPPAQLQKAKANVKSPFFDGTPYLPLLEFRTGTVAVNLPSGAIDLNLRLSYPDAAKAQAAKDAAVKGIEYVSQSALPALKLMIPGNADPKFAQSMQSIESTLKSLSPQQSGNTVSLQVKLQTSDLENLVPRPGMAQPGMPPGGNPPGGFQPGRPGGMPQPGGVPGGRPPRGGPRGPRG